MSQYVRTGTKASPGIGAVTPAHRVVVHRVTAFNALTGSNAKTLTVYDGTSTGGTVIHEEAAATGAELNVELNVTCNDGCYVTLAPTAASSFAGTIIYDVI